MGAKKEQIIKARMNVAKAAWGKIRYATKKTD